MEGYEYPCGQSYLPQIMRQQFWERERLQQTVRLIAQKIKATSCLSVTDEANITLFNLVSLVLPSSLVER